ncbi:MAG: ABC transporter permease [Candidatus Rokubacteria bacterium]|nr:ABC transporter permease [Candidatus Rokubacteria bacterium]
MANRAGLAIGMGRDARAEPARVASSARGVLHVLGRFAVRQPLGAIGGLIVLVLIVAAIFAPLLAPYGAKDATFAQYLPPSAEFPMGTDQIGRDILSRVVWGARLSLYVGLVSVAFGITLGALWGIITAYFGGWADGASQRVVDALMARPPIVLALSLMAALGQSVNNVTMALAILSFPDGSARPVGEQRDHGAGDLINADSRPHPPLSGPQHQGESVRGGRAGGGMLALADHLSPCLAQQLRHLYRALHREHRLRHRRGGGAQLPRVGGPA